jgi:hypothetical protein
MPELPIKILYRDSVINPTTIADIKLCREPCGTETQPRQIVAITILVDTPLSILLRIQEPPHNLPPLSHLRHLSNFSDWRGIPLRNEYFIRVKLQPGLNHITWCKGAATGMEASFFPPPYGDWPNISPYPINPQHDLKFFLYSSAERNYHPAKLGPSCPSLFTTHLSLSKQPPSLAVYYIKGTVPSLQLVATLAVMGCGYLMPATISNMRIPHRLVDETYHPLRICWTDGAVAHY